MDRSSSNEAIRAKTGVLLVNLGTPDAPTRRAVRRYLREFLSDPRVLDMPAPLRFLLLRLVILPFRPRRAAAAYQKIWLPEGSPLRVHGRALERGVAEALAAEPYAVSIAMRYGAPSIAQGLATLREAGCREIAVVPLFPQYSAAAFSSAVARVYEVAADSWDVANVRVVAPFFDHPGFIEAAADAARPGLESFEADHVLFSYHGLPEKQIRKSDPQTHCFASKTCCDAMGPANASCYRAHCFATTRALIPALGLPRERCSTAFQSRLGRTPWITPHTDVVLPELAAKGIRRLAVLCPSFVADCLETVEEIGIRAREQWTELGGEELRLLPCVNAEPVWVDAVASMVRAVSEERAPRR